jgi:glycosyltransferase involved in cell wall biosynthesis
LSKARNRGIKEAKGELIAFLDADDQWLPEKLQKQWDRRLEARLGAALFSVQAIKGVEIGEAFANARLPGTQAHDPIRLEQGELVRPTSRRWPGRRRHDRRAAGQRAMNDRHHAIAPATVDLATGLETPTTTSAPIFGPVPPCPSQPWRHSCWQSLIEKPGGDRWMRCARFAPCAAWLSDFPWMAAPISADDRPVGPEHGSNRPCLNPFVFLTVPAPESSGLGWRKVCTGHFTTWRNDRSPGGGFHPADLLPRPVT